MSSEVLLTRPNHRIVHHRPERSRKTRVLITFGESGMSDAGPWTQLALERGHETIHISSASAYQGLEVEDVAEALTSVLDGRKAITCGSGVGGYAAIYFGSAIASQIIAFSPRHDGHPTLGRGAAGGEWTHAEALTDLAKHEGTATVVFDPADAAAQTLVAQWLQPAYPQAQSQPLFLAGTDTARALDEAGQLVPFLEKSLNGYVPKKVKPIFAPNSAKGLWAQGLSLWFEGDTKNALATMLQSARTAPEAGTLMDIAARAQSVSDGDALRAVASLVGEHELWASMNGKTARLLLNAQRKAPAVANG
ncbi:hypothetical protein [Falsirhodobacter sp. 20TX0035]|uniref:hypothetical protein n=1 Tax=Falsirhodobacter sp. 20TX0035 TaxID=3022019 RepID=UPI00232D90AF|nr:hypothetical protein [Falsirhodobacter sp. 20TX0035]MDB6453508.1 hypothetical protein [Falsirhodobacter sp. 20TX0035]